MILAVDQHNIELVLPLVRSYQEFYQCAHIDDDVNRNHFEQFGPKSDKGCLFLYVEDGVAIAFATVYFSYSSTLPGKVGVMNDLFTTEPCRGRGIARMLIEHCLTYAKSMGAARIQWFTATNNDVAQRLYDSINTKKSEWYFYTYAG